MLKSTQGLLPRGSFPGLAFKILCPPFAAIKPGVVGSAAQMLRFVTVATTNDSPQIGKNLAIDYLWLGRTNVEAGVASGRQALALSSTNHAFRRWFLITAGLAALRDAKPAEAEPLLTEALKYSNRSRIRMGWRSLTGRSPVCSWAGLTRPGPTLPNWRNWRFRYPLTTRPHPIWATLTTWRCASPTRKPGRF